MDARIYQKTVYFFEQLLQRLHPFMPFVTEEIYHLLQDRDDDLCMNHNLEKLRKPSDSTINKRGVLLKTAITAIRDARNKNQLKPKDPVKLYIQASSEDGYKVIESILSKQVNASAVEYVHEMPANTIVIAEGKDKFYLETTQVFDTAGQKEELLKELGYLKGFLMSVNKNYNERFVQNAKPEVIDL